MEEQEVLVCADCGGTNPGKYQLCPKCTKLNEQQENEEDE
jgi:ribosomal protein L40E